jgi:CheY-like chemotaxis protein
VPLSETGAEAPTVLTPPDMTAAGQDKIAFLVENDDDLRRAIGLLLEKWGLSVLEAATGEDALALIDELGILPDFLLVDHQLGAGMDGLAFLDALTARHGRVPARLVTADRSAELRQTATARGVELLIKPIDARALQTAVAGLTTKGP